MRVIREGKFNSYMWFWYLPSLPHCFTFFPAFLGNVREHLDIHQERSDEKNVSVEPCTRSVFLIICNKDWRAYAVKSINVDTLETKKYEWNKSKKIPKMTQIETYQNLTDTMIEWNKLDKVDSKAEQKCFNFRIRTFF